MIKRREEQLRKEVAASKKLAERAKKSKNQLKELYDQRKRERVEKGREATKELFNSMKEEYFRNVLRVGQLEDQIRDLKPQVLSAKNSVANLQRELQNIKGFQGQKGNPWQVGVPYGSKAGRSGNLERDKYGRPIRDKTGQSRK